MKFRKSITIIICCVVMFTLPLYGCGVGTTITSLAGDSKPTVEKTLTEAEYINSNSNLGLVYLEPSSVPSEEAEKRFGIDHPESTGDSNGFVKGYYFNYPDGDEARYLTQIYIEGGKYDLFGIKVDSDVDAAKEILNRNGYKNVEASNVTEDNCKVSFEKYDVIVDLTTGIDSSKITRISILTDTHRPETDIVY